MPHHKLMSGSSLLAAAVLLLHAVLVLGFSLYHLATRKRV